MLLIYLQVLSASLNTVSHPKIPNHHNDQMIRGKLSVTSLQLVNNFIQPQHDFVKSVPCHLNASWHQLSHTRKWHGIDLCQCVCQCACWCHREGTTPFVALLGKLPSLPPFPPSLPPLPPSLRLPSFCPSVSVHLPSVHASSSMRHPVCSLSSACSPRWTLSALCSVSNTGMEGLGTHTHRACWGAVVTGRGSS